MNFGKEFEKYAVKHRGISSNTLDSYIKHNVTNLTPNIIEERPMNVAVMDSNTTHHTQVESARFRFTELFSKIPRRDS